MAAPIETLALHHGPLSFSAWACGEGPPVICLHGFPDHAPSLRPQLEALADAGYRAIAPMLRGYEPSSQPDDEDYTLGAIAGDVIAWLDELEAPRAQLFGHDWGAAVSYVAGARAPERFASLATLAVPHAGRFGAEGLLRLPSQLLKSWYMIFFQLRGLAEYALERDGWALVARLWQDWSPGYALSRADWEALVRTFEAPGVKRAMLAYYRQNLGSREMRELREIPVPTLAVTGADDGCIDTRLYDRIMKPEDFPAGLELRRISGAGHFAHLEKPDEFNALLIDWFRRHPV